MRLLACAWLLCLPLQSLFAAELFRIATYNVENYLLQSNETRVVKPPDSRAKVREHLLAVTI